MFALSDLGSGSIIFCIVFLLASCQANSMLKHEKQKIWVMEIVSFKGSNRIFNL